MVAGMKKQVAQLVAENECLRRQLASTNYRYHRHLDLTTIPFASSGTIFSNTATSVDIREFQTRPGMFTIGAQSSASISASTTQDAGRE
jgi:hypothetical protein